MATSRRADAAPEPAGPDDEVAAALVERFAGAVFVDSHGQTVVYIAREPAGRDVARVPA